MMQTHLPRLPTSFGLTSIHKARDRLSYFEMGGHKVLWREGSIQTSWNWTPVRIRPCHTFPSFPHQCQHTDLLISMHQHNAQVCGLQASSSNDGDVVALTDVVDVDRYAGICANAVLLHEWNQLTLCQVVRGRGLFLDQLHLRKKIKSCSFCLVFLLC